MEAGAPIEIRVEGPPQESAVLAWIGRAGADTRPFVYRIGADAQPWGAWTPTALGPPGPVTTTELLLRGPDHIRIAWRESTPGSLGAADLRFSMLSYSTGAPFSGADTRGRALAVADGDQYDLRADEPGINFAWTEERAGSPRARVQRVGMNGAPVAGWPEAGLGASDIASEQRVVAVTGEGDAPIVLWLDDRNGVSELYANFMRIFPQPGPGWPSGGLRVTTSKAGVRDAEALPKGDAVPIAWTVPDGEGGSSVRAAIIGIDGAVSPRAGLDVSSLPGVSAQEAQIATSVGSSAVFWIDSRSGDADIWARYVSFGPVLEVGSAPEVDFAIHGARPSPARAGSARLAFTLSDASAASLSLHDLAGRRLWVREVGALGAGRHELPLGSELRPGLYFARLTRSERSVSMRVVIVD